MGGPLKGFCTPFYFMLQKQSRCFWSYVRATLWSFRQLTTTKSYWSHRWRHCDTEIDKFKCHITSMVLMVALWNRADHYIFALWLFLSFFFFFFASPNLSRRRSDVCHTSTHGVALVRISDAGLKRAAHGSLQIQDANKFAKNRHRGTIVQVCRTISSQLRHVSTIGKKNI